MSSSASAQDATSQEPASTSRSGSIRVERVIEGKDAPDFWKNGLTKIEYRIYESDSTLADIEIRTIDFLGMYEPDFGNRARIWDSELLLVDTVQRKLVITNRFGLPESDNETHVLCIADFEGNKAFMDSPWVSSSGTNISFNKIVNGNGVYDFTEPLLEFTSCCTVFSDLINERTLFYVVDWQDERRNGSDNAFLIDFVSKDTLESFLFSDFSYELGYTALITMNKQLGFLALLNSSHNELVMWDSVLNKSTFDMSKVALAEKLEQGPNSIVMYSFPPGKVIVQLDDRQKPVLWNK